MRKLWPCLFALGFAALARPAAAVPVVAYEWTEGGAGNGINSVWVSRHGVNGPVLADDFVPTVSGRVVQVDWWGSAPLVVGGVDQFEVTFHTDTGAGTPFPTPGFGGIAQHTPASPGVDPDGDGVFFYSVPWQPRDVFVTAGTTYWFSVADFNCTNLGGQPPGPACLAGWNWANAGGAAPTVGAEAWTAVDSFGVGPNGGPHFGPWNALTLNNDGVTKQDFAFRIWVETPEPATLGLAALALLGLLGRRRVPGSGPSSPRARATSGSG